MSENETSNALVPELERLNLAVGAFLKLALHELRVLLLSFLD